MRYAEFLLEWVIILFIITQIIFPIIIPRYLSFMWILKNGKFWFWQTKKIKDAKNVDLLKKTKESIEGLNSAHKKAEDVKQEIIKNLENAKKLKKNFQAKTSRKIETLELNNQSFKKKENGKL